MALSDEELDRYARHIVLREVGGGGQRKLKEARVLVVGAGGLGSPVILYLAAAGVGTIGIADFDTVSPLQPAAPDRPSQHRCRAGENGVGARRGAGHQSACPHRDPCRARRARQRAGADRALRTSSPTGRTISRRASSSTTPASSREKTLVSAAVTEFDGQLATFKAHEAGCPCYRCLFPEAPPPGTAPSCSETGVLGAAAGRDGNAAGAGG